MVQAVAVSMALLGGFGSVDAGSVEVPRSAQASDDWAAAWNAAWAEMSAGSAVEGTVEGATEETAGDQRGAVVERVAGEPEHEVERTDWGYRAGPMVVDTKLPVGYPRPTPAGAVEVKSYPSVRRAEVTVAGGPADRRAANGGFFPLFRHITSRDIAMTAPVEMDFSAGEDGGQTATMSFLYETTEDGPTGEAENNVTVVDADPVTVVSLGMRGRPDQRRLRTAVRKLEAWASEQAGWATTGEYRWLGYNGPSVPRRVQWYEVQVVLERVGTGDDGPAGRGSRDDG